MNGGKQTLTGVRLRYLHRLARLSAFCLWASIERTNRVPLQPGQVGRDGEEAGAAAESGEAGSTSLGLGEGGSNSGVAAAAAEAAGGPQDAENGTDGGALTDAAAGGKVAGLGATGGTDVSVVAGLLFHVRSMYVRMCIFCYVRAPPPYFRCTPPQRVIVFFLFSHLWPIPARVASRWLWPIPYD